MRSKFDNSSISMRENPFLKEWSWFKFNNLGLVQDMSLEFLQQYGERVKTKS